MTIEAASEKDAARPVRYGMIGGGEGAFIGAVHRIAARLDGRFALVAGALSSSAEKARRSGRALGLADERSYPDFAAMMAGEAGRPDGIEAVVIVTPNHVHVPAARAALEAGLHVICDKPLADSLEAGLSLEPVVRGSARLFAVTYNYTAYPLVREARALVASGALGTIRTVQAEYVQDWLTEKLEDTGHKQAEWRTDPARSGAGGAIGDIGTHAFNLAEFITGDTVASLAADLTSFVEGRPVDDNAQILLRFASGARGSLWVSQVAPGHENGLRIRIYGSKGSIRWGQENPNELLYSPFGDTTRIVTRAGNGATAASSGLVRIPAGHPEGYLEAFATLYDEIADAIVAARGGGRPDAGLVPGIDAGLRGLRFVSASIRSSRAGGVWTEV
ncbi:Gfo/Idh/MocA family protein [Prosthecomicrobium sp. N25]|uniref:Gfo/Idh/MocA family protein n=1 Tax=Prosthecomicrobium sp. N25 TaxID=3129254 RepID=UPI003077A043